MRRAIVIAALLAGAAAAVIVDRIAITVSDRIITDSEIAQRLRLSAFQNKDQADLSLAARRKAAEMLVDQKIVEREMDVGHYPQLPEARRKELVDSFAKENYKGDREALNRALAEYGLTAKDLEDDLARQSGLLTFLSLRFRPAVEVSDREVQEYFRDKIVRVNPRAELNDFRARIERQITQTQADLDLDAWLRDQRKRTKIVYLEKELNK